MTANPRRRRFGPLRVLALISLLGATLANAAAPADSAIAAPKWVRQIGKPGHAFVYPWGMATAKDGTILTSDYNNYNIKRFTPDGAYLGSFATKGTGPGQINQPYQIAVDPRDGAVWVADVINGELDKFAADGTWLFAVKPSGPDVKPYSYVARVAVNSLGWVYAVHSHNTSPDWPHRVLVYDAAGTLLDRFGALGTADGEFNVMRGIGIGPGDEVFVADNGNRRIQVFDKDGNFLRKFGQGGTSPGQFGFDLRGVTVDAATRQVFVVDASQGHIEVFDLAGNYRRTIGEPGAEPGQIGGGREITIGPDGHLYLADYTYFRINIYTTDGTFLREIPNPAQPAPVGGFNSAEDVAVDPSSGAVYVADTYNHRVQKFGPVTVSSTGAYGGGSFVKAWGFRGLGAPDAMNYPRGVAVDRANGNVWLNNTRTGDVKAYTSQGDFVRSFGTQGAEPSQFNYARGGWVTPSGRLLIADSSNLRLKVIDQFGNNVVAPLPCGVKQTVSPRLLNGCTGVTQDAAGNIYAAAPAEHVVYKWNANYQLLAKFGTAGQPSAVDGRFNTPYDVAVIGSRLYVSDRENNRVQVLSLTGGFLGKWGSLGGAHGQFRRPAGLSVDGAGRIYVMDLGNERVEVFVP